MRTLTRLLLMGALVVAFGVISTPDAIAQEDEASFLTVTEPLNVGGTVLQPGKYVIRLMPSFSNRNLLQVSNEDRSQIYATVLSIPHAYAAGSDKSVTEFVMYPAVAGEVRALRTWFAPNSATGGGHDIVFPERVAMALAPLVKEPVIAYKGEPKAEQLPKAPLVTVTPKKEVIAYVEPAPKPVQVARIEALPPMSSRVPLVATIGLLLIGFAIGIRALRVV
jgi:hypothetical protein